MLPLVRVKIALSGFRLMNEKEKKKKTVIEMVSTRNKTIFQNQNGGTELDGSYLVWRVFTMSTLLQSVEELEIKDVFINLQSLANH